MTQPDSVVNFHPWEDQLTGISEARQWREPLPYLVDGMVPCGRVLAFSGAPGSLKSMILMHMGCCVAGGLSWLNHEVTQAPVLWYNADSPTDAIQDRLGALANGLSMEGAEQFHLLSFPSPGLDLSNSCHIGSTIAFIKKRGIRLFFVDALQRVRGGANENDATEMSKIMDGARRIVEKTGCTILFVHHTGKPSGDRAASYRGSSAIMDALDGAFTITRDKATVTIEPTKEREAPVEGVSARFDFLHFEGTRKLETASFVEVEPVERIDTAELEAFKLRQDILDTIENWKGESSPGKEDIRRAVGGNAKRFYKAINELIEDGRLEMTQGPNRKQFLHLTTEKSPEEQAALPVLPGPSQSFPEGHQ